MDPLLNLAKNDSKTATNPLGDAFKFKDDHIDEDFISDLLVKFKMAMLATLFTINDNANFLMCLPRKNFNHGFKLGDRIDEIAKEENTAILVVQYEDRMSTGDYVVVKTKLDGSLVTVHNIYRDNKRLCFLTALDRDIIDNDEEMLQILYNIVTGELETYKMNDLSSAERYTARY